MLYEEEITANPTAAISRARGKKNKGTPSTEAKDGAGLRHAQFSPPRTEAPPLQPPHNAAMPGGLPMGAPVLPLILHGHRWLGFKAGKPRCQQTFSKCALTCRKAIPR